MKLKAKILPNKNLVLDDKSKAKISKKHKWGDTVKLELVGKGK